MNTCRWCGREVTGSVSICSAQCFRAAAWCGWWDAKRLWEKRKEKAKADRDYPNSGILFREKEKKEERDRDYRGEADVTCSACGHRFTTWLSGWIREGRNASKFLTLKFTAKDKTVACSASR